jgi:hypothetical protein
MQVKFLQDFQGRETKEVFYRSGQEVDLPDHIAQQLLADRRVELVKPAEVVHFENVTGVDMRHLNVEPQFEQAEEPPKPKVKRGRK